MTYNLKRNKRDSETLNPTLVVNENINGILDVIPVRLNSLQTFDGEYNEANNELWNTSLLNLDLRYDSEFEAKYFPTNK